MQKSLRER